MTSAQFITPDEIEERIRQREAVIARERGALEAQVAAVVETLRTAADEFAAAAAAVATKGAEHAAAVRDLASRGAASGPRNAFDDTMWNAHKLLTELSAQSVMTEMRRLPEVTGQIVTALKVLAQLRDRRATQDAPPDAVITELRRQREELIASRLIPAVPRPDESRQENSVPERCATDWPALDRHTPNPSTDFAAPEPYRQPVPRFPVRETPFDALPRELRRCDLLLDSKWLHIAGGAAEEEAETHDTLPFLEGIPSRPLDDIERQITDHERVVADVDRAAARTEALLRDINYARHAARSFMEEGGHVPPELLPQLDAVDKKMDRSVDVLRRRASEFRYELLALESSAWKKRAAARHESDVSKEGAGEVPLLPYASQRWALGEMFSMEDDSRFALTDRTCAHCGTHLMVRQRRFCSRYCRDMHLSIAWLA